MRHQRKNTTVKDIDQLLIDTIRVHIYSDSIIKEKHCSEKHSSIIFLMLS